MSISEIKSALSLSDLLIVGYDDGAENDVPALTVAKIMHDNKIKVLKCLHGRPAETAYRALIDV